MSSRNPKATAKVEGASIISLLQNPYGKSGLFKAILVETTEEKHAPFLWFSGIFLYCVVRVPPIQFQIYRWWVLKSPEYVAAFCVMSIFVLKSWPTPTNLADEDVRSKSSVIIELSTWF